LRADGVAFAVADALDDSHLRTLAEAASGLALVVAGSGLAIGIPALHGFEPGAQAAWLPPTCGHRAIVSGSCSAATNAQVAAFIGAGGSAFVVDPLKLAAGDDVAAQALAWATPRLGDAPVLVAATAEPAAVQRIQAALGAERAGALVEAALARVAVGLVQAGVGQLLVAGGETSGACVQALGIRQLRIGPQIDPGVPWCHAERPGEGPDEGPDERRGERRGEQRGLHLALKSGNFGGVDFFSRAFTVL
jgi:3-dehydrotetronate 4-kinase